MLAAGRSRASTIGWTIGNAPRALPLARARILTPFHPAPPRRQVAVHKLKGLSTFSAFSAQRLRHRQRCPQSPRRAFCDLCVFRTRFSQPEGILEEVGTTLREIKDLPGSGVG